MRRLLMVIVAVLLGLGSTGFAAAQNIRRVRSR